MNEEDEDQKHEEESTYRDSLALRAQNAEAGKKQPNSKQEAPNDPQYKEMVPSEITQSSNKPSTMHIECRPSTTTTLHSQGQELNSHLERERKASSLSPQLLCSHTQCV